MSYDLTFFAYHKGVTDLQVRQAIDDLYNDKPVDWPGSAEFDAFYQTITTAFPENEAVSWHTETKAKGYWLLSMAAGEAEFNRYIGGQLMMHSVISYNPQTDEVMLELEPL